MSHQICYKVFNENVNRKAVLAAIQAEAERYGDGYSGPLKFHDEIQPLESRDAAEARIRSLDKGWYDDHAVRYIDHSEAKETKRMTEIRTRIRETREKANAYSAEHAVTSFKAEYIGCSVCGSKVARKYLRSSVCPVCRADMRSETTKKTLESYETKIRDLNDQLERERRKQAGKVMWLVKYEYHC